MAREKMTRRASDNEYLHKDFHGALSGGIDYLDKHYGEDAVREYLRRFTSTYYAPLKEKIRESGLAALRDHFEELYRIEGGNVQIEFSENEIIINVDACPAVLHMRKHNYHVARLFFETTRTVNDALCDGTPYAAELLEYDQDTGRSVQRFYRRSK